MLFLLSSGPSCAFRHSRQAKGSAAPSSTALAAPAPAAAQPPLPTQTSAKDHRVGVVRVIGDAQRFVLVEIPPSGAGPLPGGTLLRCAPTPAADAPTSASLRVATERRQPYVVADVLSGEPHVGDSVYMDRSADAASNAKPTILPTATSGVLPIVIPGGSATPPHP